MTDEPPFYLTRAGRQFYDSTMPELVRQVARLNELLERIVTRMEREDDRPARSEEDDPCRT